MAARATWTDEDVVILNTAHAFIELAARSVPGFERHRRFIESWAPAVTGLAAAMDSERPRQLEGL